MKINTLNNVLFNPILTANLILHFLNGTKEKQIKLELIYFVLPIIYDKKLFEKLIRCTSASTIKTFLESDIKVQFLEINTRINDFRQITNNAIITLSNFENFKLEISDFIKLKTEINFSYKSEQEVNLKEYYKAANNLGSIFSKESYKSIFYNF